MNKPEINVTPLIDVLLVLLIIFMLITPTKPAAFKAKVPAEPQKDGAKAHPHTIVLAVEKNAVLRINNVVTDATADAPAAAISQLVDIFRLRSENGVTERTVFIKAPHDLNYGTVAKVVDAVKASGADPISLQIDGLE